MSLMHADRAITYINPVQITANSWLAQLLSTCGNSNSHIKKKANHTYVINMSPGNLISYLCSFVYENGHTVVDGSASCEFLFAKLAKINLHVTQQTSSDFSSHLKISNTISSPALHIMPFSQPTLIGLTLAKTSVAFR